MRDYILKWLASGLAVAAALIAPASAGHRGEAIAYKHPNFEGPAISITGPIENLAYERFNDTISSIELNGAWEICVDPNFRGKCRIIYGSVARLADIRMNDNITSLRPVSRHDRRYGDDRGGAYDNRDSALVLFKDPGYRGQALGLDRAAPNLAYLRFNDTISSIVVNRGQWLVCEHPDYRGRCEVVDASVGSVKYIGLNDRITSIRPLRRGDRYHADYSRRDRAQGSRYGHANRQAFFQPRNRYGERIRHRGGAGEAFCRSNGFNRVFEVETSGRYIQSITCMR